MDKPTPPIHVFRAGKHLTAAGETIEFSQADLAATAAAYNRAIHEAPLVIGHPKTDDPAFGWAEGMTADSTGLHVAPGQVNPQFAEMVQSGAFKKISVAWYRPGDAANPVPGVWYPRHIGFLGATPPSIKGLNPVQFREGGEPVEIEFSEYDDVINAGLWRRLREWFIGQFGQDTADKVVPSWDVSDLESGAQEELRKDQAETDPLVPQFSEPSHHQETPVTLEEKTALETENAALKTKLAAAEARDKAAVAATRRTEAVQFCEGLIQAGRLLPVEKDTVLALYDLAATSAPVEFGEGDGKTTEAPLAKFKALLENLPKRVEFKEVGGGDMDLSGGVEFSAPDRYAVDAVALATHNRALAYQAAHPATDYIAAIKAVSQGA